MVLDVNAVLTGKQLASIMAQKTASNVEAELAQVFTSQEVSHLPVPATERLEEVPTLPVAVQHGCTVKQVTESPQHKHLSPKREERASKDAEFSHSVRSKDISNLHL